MNLVKEDGLMRFQSAFVAVLAALQLIADESLDETKTIQKIELLGGRVRRDEALPGSPVVGSSFDVRGVRCVSLVLCPARDTRK